MFDFSAKTWGTSGIITENPAFTEEPKVVADSKGRATVVWRSHLEGQSSHNGDIFSSYAALSDMKWSDAEQITRDDKVEWNISAAVGKNDEVLISWSTYDYGDSSGISKSDDVNTSSKNPGSVASAGNYKDSGKDTDNNGYYDSLEISGDLNVVKAGTYKVVGDLYRSSSGTAREDGTLLKIGTAETLLTDVSAGTQTFTLEFPAMAIFSTGGDGPYFLKNLIVLDMNEGGVSTVYASAPHTTEAYTTERFEGFDTTGDVNQDGEVDLADAVIVLQILSGITPEVAVADYVASGMTLDPAKRIGLAEAVYILQTAGGLR